MDGGIGWRMVFVYGVLVGMMMGVFLEEKVWLMRMLWIGVGFRGMWVV